MRRGSNSGNEPRAQPNQEYPGINRRFANFRNAREVEKNAGLVPHKYGVFRQRIGIYGGSGSEMGRACNGAGH